MSLIPLLLHERDVEIAFFRLRNFENKGVQKYQKFAGTIIQRADESFEAIIYASHTFRRLNLYGSITAIPSPDDRQALGELMEKIEQEFSAASSGFLRVSIGMDSVRHGHSFLLRYHDIDRNQSSSSTSIIFSPRMHRYQMILDLCMLVGAS